MNKLGKNRCIVVVLLLSLLTIFAYQANPVSAFKETTEENLLYTNDLWISIDDSNIVCSVSARDFFSELDSQKNPDITADGAYSLDRQKSVSMIIDVPVEAEYYMAFEYKLPSQLVTDSSITITDGSQTVRAMVHNIWVDQSDEYPVDRFGNQFLPQQIAIDEYHIDYMRRADRIDVNPIVWDFKVGKHKITITSNTQPVNIRKIFLIKASRQSEYETYREKIGDIAIVNDGDTSDLIVIEAERYAAKSHSYLGPSCIQEPGRYPYNVYNKRLNVIGQNNNGSGYKLLWTFNVKRAGDYKLAFLYNQNSKKEMPVFADIEIDGKTLFKEMNSFDFEYTGQAFENLIFANEDGKPYLIRLEEGRHTLAIRYNGAVYQDLVDELKDILWEINDTGLEIKKISGMSNDKNRVWDIEQYFPDILDRFQNWQVRLQKVYNRLSSFQKENPAGAVNIRLAIDILNKLVKEPDKIPARLNELNEGSGSAAQYIGDIIPIISNQVFILDRIYLYQDGDLPPAEASIWGRLVNGIKAFFYSFTNKGKGNRAITKGPSDELEFWVSGSIAYVETLQRLADAQFMPKHGYSVRFSMSPDDSKLLLANAAGVAPDGALGIAQHFAFQFAIRGALEDFTQFDDFAPFVKDQFNINTLTPHIYEDKVYAITERQDFFVMMYRRDILDKLNIEVPETWDDVKNIMPTLRRQGMSFYIPLSSAVGLKPFFTTLPFIFQSGGVLYSNGGTRTLLDGNEAISGFKLMTDLYNIYAFDKQTVNFYNSFRYGTVPIGVGSYNDYLMLKTAAPEIADLWDIALAPGIRDKDSNINREHLVTSTVDVIMKGGNKDKAWEFIRWWLSEETQLQYANIMQTQYGPAFMWNTANLKAFSQLPIEEEHLNVILKQWESIRQAEPHPATYMVERSLSNAWIDTVMNGVPYRVAMDRRIVSINREIIRKLEEFGYTKNGQKIKNYSIKKIGEILE
jgi:ABC-type glycerol-3-phosphate transport system substrate-binding protein